MLRPVAGAWLALILTPKNNIKVSVVEAHAGCEMKL